MFALPIGRADVVLEVQCLTQLSTMSFNFQDLSMTFSTHEKMYKLLGYNHRQVNLLAPIG